jgi:hypothetical protein
MLNKKKIQKRILTFLSWEIWERAAETDDVIDNDGEIISRSERS